MVLSKGLADQQILWEMVDGEGRSIAGNKSAVNGSAGQQQTRRRTQALAVPRSALSAETGLPWTLYITAAQGPAHPGPRLA